MAKAALPGFEKFQKVGEGYLETVVRVAYATESLRGIMDTLGVSTVLTVDIAMGLVDVFGGLETAMDQIGAYYDAFYTEAEKEAAISRQLAKSFEELGLSMIDIDAPDARQQSRDLVEAQDLTTESGRETYAALLAISGTFASVTTAATEVIDPITAVANALNALRNETRSAEDIARNILSLEQAMQRRFLYQLQYP